MTVLQTLAKAGFSSYLAGHSALRMYFDSSPGLFLWVETEGSLVDLSRLFDGLSYPGSEYFDAALDMDGTFVLFHCVDPAECPEGQQASLQGGFLYDIRRGVYKDPNEAYCYLRGSELISAAAHKNVPVPPYGEMPAALRRWYISGEIALLVSSFGYVPDSSLMGEIRRDPAEELSEKPGRYSALLTPQEQRFILGGTLTGAHAEAGLNILMRSGFIEAHWPLLGAMNGVLHSKEHHPEGNVWKHTLETFSHRKIHDLPLALALLLHDCGKSYAQEQNGNRFDRHAQIGAHKARLFLKNLLYSGEMIDKVEFLVQHHMIPGAVSGMPVYRTEKIMASPLFPDLLELYRCDISSTYRGPEGYYRACRTYRAFLKHSHNPFRTSDGKKRLRLLVE